MNKQELKTKIDAQENVELAQYTTWKVGGKAELFLEATNKDQLILAIKTAREANIPVTILGWGSNVLISDNGIKGLVIRNKANQIKIGEKCEPAKLNKDSYVRLKQVDTNNYYSFDSLHYQEQGETVAVNIDAGTYLPYAINQLISQGITGLQWFSGIPGTIGGAIYNNIHGGSHFIEEFINSVEILDETNQLKILEKNKLDFDYDYSRFHKNKEVIISAKFCLYKGDKQKALATSVEWAKKKKLQPHNSAGCCFQNITTKEQTRLGLESNSWGYIIDKILGLKGKQIGGAKISPSHAAFIENTGSATSADIISLFKLIYKESKQKLGITPLPEIFFLGFEPSEVEEFYSQ